MGARVHARAGLDCQSSSCVQPLPSWGEGVTAHSRWGSRTRHTQPHNACARWRPESHTRFDSVAGVAAALLQGPCPTSVSRGQNLLQVSGKKRGGGVGLKPALTIRAAFESRVKFIQLGILRCNSSHFLSRVKTTRKWK